jgi:hypothetical protein
MIAGSAISTGRVSTAIGDLIGGADTTKREDSVATIAASEAAIMAIAA